MIESFTFKNFKNFQNETLKMNNISIIVGSNASGKTNLIEGIKYLTAVNNNQNLEADTLWAGIRGSRSDGFLFDTNEFVIDCTSTNDSFEDFKVKIATHALLDPEDYYRLYFLVDKDGKYFIHSGRVTANSKEDIEEKEERILAIYNYSLLPENQIDQDKKLHKNHEPIRDALSNTIFLDSHTVSMREYVAAKSGMMLNPNADNLSAVLYQLCQDETIKGEILQTIKNLPENEILDISFATTELGDVMLVLVEMINKEAKRVPAKLLSDGTLKCLAILAALYTAKNNSLIVIEEFDNGLHPNRARSLLNTIFQIVKDKNINLIITTHNSAVLNSLNKELLSCVTVCYRCAQGYGKLIKLTDIENYLGLLAQGKLGNLLAEDKIADYIKNPKIANDNLDWLVN